MPEPYALIEYKFIQARTMPPSRGRELVWLHAAFDSEGGEVTAACPFQMVSDRDVFRRELPFDNSTARRQRVPMCPECVAVIEPTA